MVPITAIPLDLPVFQPNRAKSDATYAYRVSPGPVGAKSTGMLFQNVIRQQANAPSKAMVRQLSLDRAKGKGSSSIEVRIQSGERTVSQVWREGRTLAIV